MGNNPEVKKAIEKALDYLMSLSEEEFRRELDKSKPEFFADLLEHQTGKRYKPAFDLHYECWNCGRQFKTSALKEPSVCPFCAFSGKMFRLDDDIPKPVRHRKMKMKKKPSIKINKWIGCQDCMFVMIKRQDTGDWFENGCVNRVSCRKRSNKLIGYTETTGTLKKPAWCPLKAERKSNLKK